jgi:amino acid adenylation domain-containing protein
LNRLSLAQQLMDSAKRHSARPAVCVGDRKYSYEELFAHASRIASGLAPASQPGSVGVLMVKRDFNGLAAVLGTLLAGMAYVPFGRQLPLSRVSALMQRLNPAAIVLSDADPMQARTALAEMRSGSVLVLDEQHADAAPAPAHLDVRYLHEIKSPQSLPAKLVGDDRDDWAYVLFTSGSTGVPKAVPITRGSVVDYVAGIAEHYPYTPQDRCTQLFELTFDLSAHDLFCTWSAGACLYVPTGGQILGAVDLVRRHELTTWFSGPSALTMFERMRKLTPGAMPSLRLAFACGERLGWAQARLLAQAAPNARIVNLYGPTEATIAITHFDCSRASAKAQALLDVPIGWPLGRQQAVALNDSKQPINQGESGELLLGGSQLSKGYLGDCGGTQKKFFELNLRPDWPLRWYRSGDLVSFDPDYGYLYKGRIDHELKISGHRVHLGEVESLVSAALNGIWVAAMPAHIGHHGHPERIWLFILSGSAAGDEVLRACRTSLPPYLVPERVVPIDAIPHNAQGKLDRKALEQHMHNSTDAARMACS